MSAATPLSPPQAADEHRGRGARSRLRHESLLGAVLVLLAFVLLAEAKLWRPETRFTIRENIQIGEAEAWWKGRLDLPERRWDTSFKDGRVYSYFPPMFTIIATAVVPFCDGVPHWFIVLLVLAVPVLAYVLFYRLTESPIWGALLAIGCVCGTSIWPVIDKTLRGAAPYNVNHTIATIGLLIFLIAYLGGGRVWLAGAGLVLAGLSRQLTVAYLIPLAYLSVGRKWCGRRLRRLTALAVTCLVVFGVPAMLNAMKFGAPYESGYMLNYADRDDTFARDARQYGLFSAHYVPRNIYYTNIGLPKLHRIEVAGTPQVHIRPNDMGTGIWWTTPLLLWVFVKAGPLLRDRQRLMLLAAVAVAYVALMFWHGTGSVQRGFNRYSLDYVPVVLALVAPSCVVGWRRWITIGMVLWGVAYFKFVPGMPHVRIW